ncbi:MAG: glucosidase, partial [Bacteroidota bacterium]
MSTPEHSRLQEALDQGVGWKDWGPYVAERAWGTVREDYSQGGNAWQYFPFDYAHLKAYRWNEDGLAGYCNRYQNVCLAVALWNGKDPILKERLFGLSGPEGNHGEDVKELYYYLDALPSHAYGKYLYKYPQDEYPYQQLREANQHRSLDEDEFEITDALGEAFAAGRYFDVYVEYAKAGVDDLLCRIRAVNRGSEPAPLHILPHVWFRNTWTWDESRPRPAMNKAGDGKIELDHHRLGERWWWCQIAPSSNGADDAKQPRLLFCENETNTERLYSSKNQHPHTKDGINRFVVSGDNTAISLGSGTKGAAHIRADIGPGETFEVQVRFASEDHADPFATFDAVFDERIAEADAFYETIHRAGLSDDERLVQRQAFAGLLWTKQFYHYSVELWLRGDPSMPAPPQQRKQGRNNDWEHLYNVGVVSMPDKWEYPWYAVWDLAFHVVPLAMIDPQFAKRQVLLVMREWYMHPNGQLPAYEWAFDDVNPPVHAWAAWQVYQITKNEAGEGDTVFLERAFHKLLLNFTWWVNRKDRNDNNIFQGGFLGLDNIGVFDRSAPLPTGGYLEQADGTAWMGMFCLNMLTIALELARTQPAYEDVATKFFEHFIYIANAINKGCGGHGLWDEEDGFYYDYLHLPNEALVPLKVKSMVGLIPLFGVTTLDLDVLEALPAFRRRMGWFVKYRPHLLEYVAEFTQKGKGDRRLIALMGKAQLKRVLERVLDEEQFLSPHGIRSLSKEHERNPYRIEVDGRTFSVGYSPAESRTSMFGGNSNWRGPVWFPLNYLLIESLQTFDNYYGD